MTRAHGRVRVAPWVARTLAVLAAALAALAVALPVLGDHPYLADLLGTPEVVVAVSFSATGAVLVGNDQARRIGWLLLAIGVGSAVYAAALSWTAYALQGDEDAALPPGADLARITAWVTAWAWLPGWGLVSTVLPQVIPYGRPLSPRWRVPVALAGLAIVLGVLEQAVAPGPLGFFERVENPYAVPWLHRALAPLGTVLPGLLLALSAVALVSVAVRVARADAAERRQVGWVGYAVGLVVVLVLLAPDLWANLAVLLIPLGIAVAALRYRLYDLDLLVNRTLVAGVLLAAAAVAYLALVGWVGALVGTSGGVVPFAAAFVVALLFHPARLVVQRWVDRLFFGRRGDPLSLLRDLDRTLRDAASPREALASAVSLVQEGLRLSGATVSVTMPTGGVVEERAGQPFREVETLPLRLHEQEVGVLSVGGRGPEGRLAATDVRVLQALAGPLASAAYALRLSGDLEESRRRLLEAREDERRRLRRDLHDGLGPQLAGVVMGLEVIESSLSRGDTGVASELAATVGGQARTAVTDVRRLVAGLRPPVLDDLGLLGALQATGPAAHAAEGTPRFRFSTSGDLTGLPAAVEVAAYRIASEAMTNAVRHAEASQVDVRLCADPGRLLVEVQDDGVGLREGAGRGVGTSSMRERAVELGGSCSVRNNGTGTLVRAELPWVAA